jgi:hypothetical protein
MFDHPPSRPRLRSLVRTSQRSRSERQALHRAYELALPVLRQPLAADSSVEEPAPVQQSLRIPNILCGG